MFPTDSAAAEDELVPKPSEDVDASDSADEATDQEANEKASDETEAAASDEAGEADAQKLRDENRYYVEQLQRARADLDNYRRRVQRDQAQERRRITMGLFREMLPVHDAMLLAANADESEGSHDQLREGLRLILEKFDRVLQDANVEAIASVGEAFDPNLHEAMFQQETAEVPEGQILAEFERGYRLGEDLLRPARVTVAKAPQASEEE